ncbi:TPA_asm: hypothetical protein HUJ06_000118 [Nelumbo nucifera]|uniref:Uncharacterized protein n=1 Tax=Nelumbo nucifera TaxID=4432 RepID=A0A822ZXD9_NELNU|nr:TPA_asm: hypothetical protein HUJ06_020274 [Nelumbo nucifera]DAD49683.1 TPA_asm: hypothetical protein HUJ06_000118 [Nelumbo nucifera]
MILKIGYQIHCELSMEPIGGGRPLPKYYKEIDFGPSGIHAVKMSRHAYKQGSEAEMGSRTGSAKYLVATSPFMDFISLIFSFGNHLLADESPSLHLKQI